MTWTDLPGERPFVLLATRAEDLPADEEYALFLRYTGLSTDQLISIRLESERMPHLDLDELSGIFVGGGPFNASDPDEKKSGVQHRVEAEFQTLLDDVVAHLFAEPKAGKGRAGLKAADARDGKPPEDGRKPAAAERRRPRA